VRRLRLLKKYLILNLSLLNELREKVEIISNDLRILKGETNAAKDKGF